MTESNDLNGPAELVAACNDPRPALDDWTNAELRSRTRRDVAAELRSAAARFPDTSAAALLEEVAEEAESYGAVGHRERLDQAEDADPTEAPFGLRTADPGSGGLALFSFYTTPEARTQALLDDFAFLEMAGPDEEPQHEWAPARAALEKLLTRSPSADAVNELTRERFVVDWFGTFDDLCVGADEVAAAMREEFWTWTRDAEGAAPVGPEDRAYFATFVREHGR